MRRNRIVNSCMWAACLLSRSALAQADEPGLQVDATLLAQMLIFWCLVWFMMRFVWPKISSAVDQRTARVADGLAAAERGREVAAAARREADALRAEAHGEAQRLLVLARDRAAEIVRAGRDAAAAEGERLKADARRRIAAEIRDVREELKREIPAVATAAAARLLGRRVDAAAYGELWAELADRLDDHGPTPPAG